ncbi:MAG: hypothetical protein KDC13_06880, partial [Bacteroidetes bacterium]|nr:hypothetical protein [Bacteroidota bacterium]
MKQLRIFGLLMSLILLKPAPIQAQVNVQDSLLKFTMVHVNASLNWPLADLKDRFGFFSGIGLSAVRKTKHAW